MIDYFGPFNGTKVEVTAEGGIAALSTHQVVRHDDRAFVHAMRRICAQNCGAPLDSASGMLSASAIDSLFHTIFVDQSAASLKDDYGTTLNAADMMTYTLTVTAGIIVKTVRADDGTMPPQMRQILQAVQSTISAARK